MVVAAVGLAVRALPPELRLQVRERTRVSRPLDYPRARIRLETESLTEYHTRAGSVSREPHTVEWIHTHVRAGDVFYDVGANVGAYALVAATLGRVRVVAFEPGFGTYAQLCRNVVANRLQEAITPLQVALAERTRLDALRYSTLEPGGALHSLGGTPGAGGGAVSLPVLAFALDDLVDEFGLPPPTHMKVDVDGGELAVLRGATHALGLVRSVMVESDEGSAEQAAITALLEAAGLRLVGKHRTGGTGAAFARGHNHLFVRDVAPRTLTPR